MVSANIHKIEGMQITISGNATEITNEVANLLHQVATKIEANSPVDYEEVIAKVLESTQLSRTIDMECLKIGRELTPQEMQAMAIASGMNGAIMEYKGA